MKTFPSSSISGISNENITLLTASEENMNSQVSLRMVHWQKRKLLIFYVYDEKKNHKSLYMKITLNSLKIVKLFTPRSVVHTSVNTTL